MKACILKAAELSEFPIAISTSSYIFVTLPILTQVDIAQRKPLLNVSPIFYMEHSIGGDRHLSPLLQKRIYMYIYIDAKRRSIQLLSALFLFWKLSQMFSFRNYELLCRDWSALSAHFRWPNTL